MIKTNLASRISSFLLVSLPGLTAVVLLLLGLGVAGSATADGGVHAPAAGAYIELYVPCSRPGLVAVVQWQDNDGQWHDVAGWRHILDASNRVRWWVDPSDFGKGPFRWVVVRQEEGEPLGTTESFSLPDAPGTSVQIEVPLKNCPCFVDNNGLGVDKLDNHVVLGFGRFPSCVCIGCNLPVQVGPDAQATMWLVSVFVDPPYPAAGHKVVELDVVGAGGEALESLVVDPDRIPTVSPSTLVTDEDGLGSLITFSCNSVSPGLFRVRAQYEDRSAMATSYSPPVICISP